MDENSNKIVTAKVGRCDTIESVLNGYIDDFVTREEIEAINQKIKILNNRLKDFKLSNYKLSNRIKIRNLIVKVLSEDSKIFLDLAVELLNISEENFENIIDSFMKLTANDIDILYKNLWKKRGNDKYDVNSLKKEIGNNFEYVPDLIMSYEYRVNKDDFINNEHGLILGNTLTLMPSLESSNIFNVFEKLSYNNLIKLSKYVPNKMTDSFQTYLCFNFTYVGMYICRMMEKIESNK